MHILGQNPKLRLVLVLSRDGVLISDDLEMSEILIVSLVQFLLKKI